MTHLDLGGVVKNSDVTIAPAEHPEERAARIANEQRAKLLEDIKGMALFCVVLASIVLIGGLCVYTIFLNAAASAESQKWAQTILTALVSGGFSFLVGRAIAGAK